MNAEYFREWKQALHAAHMCTDCKKQDAYTLAGKWHCYECSQKNGEWSRKKQQDKDFCRKKLDKDKARRQERREKGVCYKCGRPLTDKRYKACGRCRAKNLANHRLHTTAKTPQSLRGKDGRCFLCNEAPCEPGFKTCPACHAKLKAQALINISKRWEKHPWKDDNKLIFRKGKGNGKG